MKRTEIQFGKGLGAAIATVLCLLAAFQSPAAGPQSSAHYVATAESLDGGGLRSASLDYTSDGSVGPGGFNTNVRYSQRGGYIGQLNNPPTAPVFNITVISNNPSEVPIASLLNTATDPDGDKISFYNIASTGSQGGSVLIFGDSFFYQPPMGFTGSDSISYAIFDSEGDKATLTIQAQVIAPPPLILADAVYVEGSQSQNPQFRFNLSTTTDDALYTIETSTNLVDWVPLLTFTGTGGPITITDNSAGTNPYQFYRVR